MISVTILASIAKASWDGSDPLSVIKDTPTGEFESGGVTWEYYVYSNYNHSVVWPVSELPSVVVVPNEAGGYPVGAVYRLSNTNKWTLDLPGSIREITQDSFVNGRDTLEKLIVRSDASIETIIGDLWQNGPLFQSSNLTEVILGEGVIAISRYSFNGSTNLNRVELPSTLTRIGTAAFSDQFDYYSDPASLPCLEEEDGNYYIGNWLITGGNSAAIRSGTKGIADDAMIGGPANLPDGIEFIGERACDSLPYYIPDSVKFIGSYAFGEPYLWFGGWGYDQILPETDEHGICYYCGWCFGPSDIEQWGYDEMAIYREEEELYGNEEWYQEQIQEDWWKEQKAQAEEMMSWKRRLVINEGTKGIASSAFNASGRGDNNILTNIVFPASLKHIGDNAFERCFALESFNAITNLETIGQFAFSQCEKLNQANLGQNLSRLSYGTFYECHELTNLYCGAENFDTLCLYNLRDDKTLNLHLYKPIKYVGRPAFSKVNISFETGITEIDKVIAGDTVGEISIPSTVTNIADNAFANCTSLTNLILNIVNSSNVTYSADSLKKINLKVVSLPYNAINYELLLITLGVSHVNYTIGTESGFGRWVLVNGLAGSGSSANFNGIQHGKSVANAFLYVFGDTVTKDTEMLHLEFKNGQFVIKTPNEQKHEGVTVRVLGSPHPGDWENAIEMKQTSDGWVMPDGTKPPNSYFFKLEVLEDR